VLTGDGRLRADAEEPGSEGGRPWLRHVFFVVIGAFVLAALLNLVGQRQTISRASTPGASLSVSSPPRVRGGLLYQARITVKAHRAIKQPELVLDEGWFEQTTVNAIEPQPSSQSSEDGRVAMVFDAMKPGDRLVVWVYFQVNPTNVGSHRTGVALRDGTNSIATVHRKQLDLP